MIDSLQHAGTTSTTQVALDKATDIKLKEIDAIFKKKKDDVVNSLLARATLVHPELHRNLKVANA
jgi:V-type H+-transporting ATPase subunit G